MAADDSIDGLGVVRDLGFDGLYAITRELRRSPGWAGSEPGPVDVTNELAIALRRNNLVAVCTRVPSDARFRRWINREGGPFQFLPPQVLAGTFRGDGRMVWMRGVHRRRAGKPDSQALGGLRIQAALNPIQHSSYVLRAAKIDLLPEDDLQVLRDLLTVSPDRSRISWKRPSHFGTFLAATVETLDLLDKALVAPDEPAPLFGDLARYETDLRKVRGAFEIVTTDPDVLRGDPDADDEDAARAELLFGTLLDVRGEAGSAAVAVDVGYGGAQAGTLVIRPVQMGDAFDLTVGLTGTVYRETILTEIKDVIEDSDLLTVYYQSGHVLTRGQIACQSFTNRPFRDIEFVDFAGFTIVREKPQLKPNKTLHDVIGDAEDDSLFAWVVRRYNRDWLLCDDGAGEVADFLHLANDGTLTIIHVKAAGSLSPQRRIAVTAFEQVVSQAAKSSRFLADNDALADHLAGPRTARSAVWHDGRRVRVNDFLDHLRLRRTSDKTYVVIVQPHLLQDVHARARTAIDDGAPTRDSHSLMLLDDLLHSTRQTMDARCDGLKIIGCR